MRKTRHIRATAVRDELRRLGARLARAARRRERPAAEPELWLRAVATAQPRAVAATAYRVDWEETLTRFRLLDTCPTTPDVLLAGAADLIERDGWEQGTYWAGSGIGREEPYRPGRACCPLGALAVSAGVRQIRDVGWALNDLPAPRLAVETLQRLVSPEGPTAPTWAVWTWNDDPARTGAEVIAALRRAAQLSAEQQCAEQPSAAPGSGGSSATTSHQTGSPNHQNDSKQTGAPRVVRREGRQG